MRRLPTLAALGAAAALTAACGNDPLSLPNDVAPTVESLLNSASGVETVGSKLFQNTHIGHFGASDALWPQLMVMAQESEATVANFGMQVRSQIPRQRIDNTNNNSVSAGNNRDWSFLTRVTRQSVLVLNALANFRTSYDAATYNRNRAFAFFTLGTAVGDLALVYDSVTVIRQSTPTDSLPGFTPAPAAMAYALEMLDSAQALASNPASTVAIPTGWMATPSATTMADFTRLIRTYKAKYRASMPRTPGEIGSVDWAAVLADAQNGLNRNFVISLNSGTNWTTAWMNQAYVGATWHQMPMHVIGLADSTGQYATWNGQPNPNKTAFTIATIDRRFPRGTTRADQIANVNPDLVPADTFPYFRNRRAGGDVPGGPTQGSQYDFYRWFGYRVNNLQLTWPLVTQAENDMLAAEAAIRTGQTALAIPLINRYRTRAGLPAIPTDAAATDLVPGGNACVPKFPTQVGTNTFTMTCGTVLEAMKYEKRMETAWSSWGTWMFDGRRWGDLITGTAIEWPVPWNETFARGRPTPNRNERQAAGPNTYGWRAD